MMIRLALLALCISGLAFAAPSCVNPFNTQGTLGGDASGSLTGCLKASDGELVFNPNTAADDPWQDLFIAWEIKAISGGYRYEYTVSDPSGSLKAISHAVIGLSANCTVANNCITNISTTNVKDSSIGTFGDEGNSNPGIPSDLYGIKLNTSGDPTTFSFGFDSNRVPVWQNFYAKDGKTGGDDVYAYNLGFSAGGTSFFVAAPDSVVPEPGFYGVLAAGLSGLYLAIRRRRTA